MTFATSTKPEWSKFNAGLTLAPTGQRMKELQDQFQPDLEIGCKYMAYRILLSRHPIAAVAAHFVDCRNYCCTGPGVGQTTKIGGSSEPLSPSGPHCHQEGTARRGIALLGMLIRITDQRYLCPIQPQKAKLTSAKRRRR